MARCLRIVLGRGWIVVHPILGSVLLDVAPPTARTGLLGDTVPAGLAGLARQRDRPAGILLAPHVVRAARRTVQPGHCRATVQEPGSQRPVRPSSGQQGPRTGPWPSRLAGERHRNGLLAVSRG